MRTSLPTSTELTLRRHVEMLDKNPFIDAQDILSKASEFGLKIWKLDST